MAQMADNGLKYDAMVERALRGVLREALSYVAEHGLPGDHHLYITFRTEHPDVDMPAQLRERYPGEMTIVLQYQFWGLEVSDDSFAVTLSFSDVPERLEIPFQAVIAFADPSVRFGLQFDGGGAEREAGGGQLAEIETLPVKKNEPKKPAAKEAPPDAEAGSDKTADGAPEGAPAHKVVTLDTFRKK